MKFGKLKVDDYFQLGDHTYKTIHTIMDGCCTPKYNAFRPSDNTFHFFTMHVKVEKLDDVSVKYVEEETEDCPECNSGGFIGESTNGCDYCGGRGRILV